MAKEILLYGDVYSYSASEFIRQMEESADDEVSVRINGEGGEPQYGWGMIAKFIEHASGKKIKVDGQAHSMYAFFLCYVDDAEALDVANFCLHRAAYSEWFEKSPEYFTDTLKAFLANTNKKLEAALRAKIDVAKFEEMKGVTIKEIFSMDGRKEVLLTASEAKQIGLINRIVKITPSMKASIESNMEKIAAKYSGMKIAAKEEPKNENQNPTYMTLAEFKAQHPAIYAQAVAEGVADGIKQGVAQEADRVGACLVFNDVDPDGVKAAIASGKPMTATQMAEFSRKSMAKGMLAEVKKDANGKVITEEPNGKEKTDKEKTVASFEAEVQASLKKSNPVAAAK